MLPWLANVFDVVREGDAPTLKYRDDNSKHWIEVQPGRARRPDNGSEERKSEKDDGDEDGHDGFS